MLGILFVAALAATIFPLVLSPYGDFLLGSIAVLMVLRLYGAQWGLLAALLAGSCTIALWHHPFAALVLIAEALMVGMLFRRGMQNILLADGIFWVFFGLPLLWLLHAVMLQAETDTVLLLLVKQGSNGIFNALIATLLFRLLPLRRWQGQSPITLWETQFNLLLACFLLPSLVVVLLNMDRARDILQPDLEAELTSESLAVRNLLYSQHKRLEGTLEGLARFAAGREVVPSKALQRKTDATRKEFPAFLRVQVADANGNTVALSSAADGKPVGLDASSRNLVERLQTSLRPVISPVRKDAALPAAHVVWSIPIMSNGRLAGAVHGALDVRSVRNLLEAYPRRSPFAITVVDQKGKVVASSDPERSSMENFLRRGKGIAGLTAPSAYLWQPHNQQFAALSFWKTISPPEIPVDESLPWGVAVEIPTALHRAYLQRTVGTALAIMLAPTVLALWLVRISSKRLVAPLKELSAVTSDLPEKLKEGNDIPWPEKAASEVHSLIQNFRALEVELENNYRELRGLKEKSTEALDDLLAQRKWEVFSTERKLKVEMDRRHRIEDLLSQLEAAEAKYRFLVEKTLLGVYILSGDRFSYVNPRFAEIFGYPPEEIVQERKLLDLVERDDKVLVSGNLRRQSLGEVDNLRYRFRGIRKDGSVIHLEVLNGKGTYNGQTAILGTLMDITERVQAEETIEHMAYHDPLTGLPNRLLFGDRVKQALAFAERNQQMVGMLFLDLDRFKAVNDTLGHAAGDQLLKELAQRLQECLRESDTISRFGGDEFNILVTQMKQESDASLVAHKILRALKFPFDIEGQELFVTCSVGIALYPRDCHDVQTLMKNADIALYRAKDMGRNNYQIYSPAMNARALERMAMENSLRRVLERNELRVHYQPQVDLRTGAIVGLEALVRWEHAVGGMIQPAAFIPLAEEIGLIAPIGEWVLRTACHQAKAWQQEGFAPLRVGVNVSAQQLKEPEFADVVAHIVAESGVEPKWINVEITESVVMEDAKEAIAKFCQLHDVGITVAIDDFGIGYSSLSYLRDFPVDQLKMDRSFVRNLPHEPNDAKIAKHIIAMAHEVGLKVLAEGVETKEQFEFLQSLGCDEVQGFLLSPPCRPRSLPKCCKRKKTFRSSLRALTLPLLDPEDNRKPFQPNFKSSGRRRCRRPQDPSAAAADSVVPGVSPAGTPRVPFRAVGSGRPPSGRTRS